jgi:hypothetical protein
MAAAWLKGILSGGLSGIANGVARIMDSNLSKSEKDLEVRKLMAAEAEGVHEEIVAELAAKERVLIAELGQGDSYTKRARPTVVYAGLGLLALNHVLLPWISHYAGTAPPQIDLPTEFWIGWSGIVATWSIGRTMEKRGANGAVTAALTGSQRRTSLTA